MTEKYGFVYIWRDRKHNRYYIGSHWGTETDQYICSSNWMRDSYKRRPEDFKRRIISRIYTTRNDLLAKEHRWLTLIKPEEIKVRYYNLKLHRFGHWTSDKASKLTIGQKISAKTKGRHLSPSTEIKPGQQISPETQFKSGVAPMNKGKTAKEFLGEEKALAAKIKSSASHKGKSNRNSGNFEIGKCSHNAKSVHTPYGNFPSMRNASIALNISKKILQKHMRITPVEWYMVN